MKTILLSLALFACVAGDNVYVCTGPHARRYHKSASCEGLHNCSREIKQVTLEQAKKLHKTPCHICCKNKRYEKES